MSKKISSYLIKLSNKLFVDNGEKSKSFVESIVSGRCSVPAVVWTKPRPNTTEDWAPLERLDLQPQFIDRIPTHIRPGKHRLHQDGFFYCLDYASVMMLLPALLYILPRLQRAPRIVDLCASPGGKTAMLHSGFKPEWLVSNEVIGKRLGPLISNTKRCGIKNVITNMDPEDLAEYLEFAADLVVVDAPCSGQNLIAKGDEAAGCFHPANINKCMIRQRRILSNASELVAPNGFLLYSTCSYSLEENEYLLDWFLKKFSQFVPVSVDELEQYRSLHSEHACYRFYPSETEGAGGFSVLLRNKVDGEQPDVSILELKNILSQKTIFSE